MTKKDRPWIRAKMIKNWKTGARAFNIGYCEGHTVYTLAPLNNGILDDETTWLIWNGSHHYCGISMNLETAREFVKVERRNGKPVIAENQKELSNNYRWMLSR